LPSSYNENASVRCLGNNSTIPAFRHFVTLTPSLSILSDIRQNLQKRICPNSIGALLKTGMLFCYRFLQKRICPNSTSICALLKTGMLFCYRFLQKHSFLCKLHEAICTGLHTSLTAATTQTTCIRVAFRSVCINNPRPCTTKLLVKVYIQINYCGLCYINSFNLSSKGALMFQKVIKSISGIRY
jgi:hypothetical protein